MHPTHTDMMVQRVQKPSVVPVNGGKSPAQPVPLRVCIVREVRMGMLKQGDHNQPEIDDEVGNDVCLGHPAPSHGLSRQI
jgi:hypothetical protein